MSLFSKEDLVPKEDCKQEASEVEGFGFGKAIIKLKRGQKVARKGWNGKGMFLLLIQGSNDLASIHKFGFGELLGEPTFADAIFMKTVDNKLIPWLASQTDVLAEDWVGIH